MADARSNSAPALRPLMSQHEAHHRLDIAACGSNSATDPAVIINPSASTGALLAAALSRVDRLKKSLGAWSEVLDSSTTADKLGETLAPLAEEAVDLLEALRLQLPKVVTHG